MTWNKIQVHIIYNINKHIKLLFLKPIRVASTKVNIGQNSYQTAIEKPIWLFYM